MPADWLTLLAELALAVGVLSALVIAGDIVAGHRQPMAVMNLVWPITGLYFGPFAVWAYWQMGRAHPGAAQNHAQTDHDHDPPKPFWQQVFVSTSHCGAGCTLGDVLGESGMFVLGLLLFGSTLLTAYVLDFALAYLFGVVFQFFAIAPMRHLGVGAGLRAAVKADTFSLIAFEVGMFAWMGLTRLGLFQPPLEPDNPVFWFMMQIAMIIGFLTSYPANWWLVKKGIKEAM